jgi:hypothetical protein
MSDFAAPPRRFGRRLPDVLAVIAVAVAACLMLGNFTGRPLGYLHRWNQVTTLAMSRGIAAEPRSFFAPRDVTSLVSWEHPGAEPDPADRVRRFVVFEEFPLYHGLTALLSATGLPLEVPAHLLSIGFWLLGLFGCRALAEGVAAAPARAFAAVTYASSFPLLYYGQATMSDIAMLAALAWAVVRLRAWAEGAPDRHLVWAALWFCLSALFKSYSVVFVLMIPYASWVRERRIVPRGFVTGLLFAAAAPVLGWHLYAAFQEGHQESASHSIAAKLDGMLRLDLFTLTARRFLRFAGPAATLGVLVWAIRERRNWRGAGDRRFWWLHSFTICLALYLAATSDKLPDHDYYYLLAVPVFVTLAAAAYSRIWESPACATSAGQALFVAALLTSFLVSARNFLKATKVSPDIVACADLLAAGTAPDEIAAVLATGERYNAINYYAGRLGLFVQGTTFPLRRYQNAGASVLVVDLEPSELAQVSDWLRKQLRGSRVIAASAGLEDFAHKRRVCQVYRLS